MLKIQSLPGFSIALSEKPEGSLRNKEKIIKYLESHQVNKKFCHLSLEHGAKRIISQKANQNKLTADAIISNNNNLCLSLVVADCFPVVIIDRKSKAFALIHAGWRSLVQNIIELTILDMKLHFDSQEKDLFVWIGPGIKNCCYHSKYLPVQVGMPSWKKSIKQVSTKKWTIDLLKFIKHEFKRLEIDSRHVFADGRCTYCENETLFSYRRAQKTKETDGRFLVAVWQD